MTALKIEGRLKTAAWVPKVKWALSAALGEKILSSCRPRRVGAYTGRALTSGYLDGQRDELTGQPDESGLLLGRR